MQLLLVARHVVEIVRRADPDAVQVPALIDQRELAARFPLHGVALDVAGALPDAPTLRPQLVHRPRITEPPDPAAWLWRQAREAADAAVVEARHGARRWGTKTPLELY